MFKAKKDFAGLQDLPRDILCRILKELDEVSKVCLKSTSYHFRCAIKVDAAKLSVCSRWLLLCRFETDYFALMKAYPPRVACALCKVKVRQECIEPQGFRNQLKSIGFERLELMKKTPHERFCVLHASRLFRYSDFFEDRLEHNPPTWIKKSQLTCMHCGRDTTADDQRSVGCDGCQCDVCPRAIQPRYGLSGHLTYKYCSPRFTIEERKRGNLLAIRDDYS